MLAPDLGLAGADVDIVLLVVPGGNAVAPPELAADAPVLDVVHPGEIGVFPVARHEFDLAVFHRLDRRFGEGVDRHVPLPRQEGLDDDAAAVAPRHFHLVRLDLFDQARPFEILDDELARGEAVHAAIALRGLVADARIASEYVDHRQIVAQADFVVVEIVGRRDLDAAAAEFRVHVLVGDDRNPPVA